MAVALLASAIFLGAVWLTYLLYNAPLMDDDNEYGGRE